MPEYDIDKFVAKNKPKQPILDIDEFVGESPEPDISTLTETPAVSTGFDPTPAPDRLAGFKKWGREVAIPSIDRAVMGLFDFQASTKPGYSPEGMALVTGRQPEELPGAMSTPEALFEGKRFVAERALDYAKAAAGSPMHAGTGVAKRIGELALTDPGLLLLDLSIAGGMTKGMRAKGRGRGKVIEKAPKQEIKPVEKVEAVEVPEVKKSALKEPIKQPEISPELEALQQKFAEESLDQTMKAERAKPEPQKPKLPELPKPKDVEKKPFKIPKIKDEALRAKNIIKEYNESIDRYSDALEWKNRSYEKVSKLREKSQDSKEVLQADQDFMYAARNFKEVEDYYESVKKRYDNLPDKYKPKPVEQRTEPTKPPTMPEAEKPAEKPPGETVELGKKEKVAPVGKSIEFLGVKSSAGDAIKSAKKMKYEKDLYVYATANGFTVEKLPPPKTQGYIIVRPNGSHKVIDYDIAWHMKEYGTERVSLEESKALQKKRREKSPPTKQQLAKAHVDKMPGDLISVKKPKGKNPWEYSRSDVAKIKGESQIIPESKAEIAKREIPEAVETPKEVKSASVVEYPIKNIVTDVDRFQNRITAFSEKTAQTIAERYDPNKFDPVVLWKDPADGNVYVLSGHSRLEGKMRLKHDTIPSRFFEGTEAEAMEFARIHGNRLQTQEGLIETIKAFKEARSKKYTKKQLEDLFDGDVKFLEAISHLNPKGKFVEILGQPVASEFGYIKRLSSWMGELRRGYGDKFTNRHENQVFEFLYKGEVKNHLMGKEEFFNLIDKQVSRIDWTPDSPLVLKRGEAPLTGTKARADTGEAEARIEELKSRQRKARTKEEKGALELEIRKIREGIGEAVKKQGDIFSLPDLKSEAGAGNLKSIREKHGKQVEKIETEKREGGYVKLPRRRIKEDVPTEFKNKHKEVEGFFARTRKLPPLQAVKNLKDRFVESFRTFPELKKKGKREYYAEAIDDLRLLKNATRSARDQAAKDLRGIIQDADYKNFELAKRSIFTDDLIWTAEQSKSIPVDLANLKKYKADLKKLLDADPKARDVIGRYREYMDAVREDLIERGKLGEEARANPVWVHHIVIDYLIGRNRGRFGRGKYVPERGYIKARAGSKRDIYTDLLEVSYAYMKQVIQDNILEDGVVRIANKYASKPIVKTIKGKKHNVLPEGHVRWSPKRGQLMTTKPSDPIQRAVVEAMEAMMKDAETVKKYGDVSPLTEIGKKDVYVLPKELARTLDDMMVYQPKGVTAGLVRSWKRWILNVNPVRYNRRNFVGDFERMVTADAPDATLVPAMKQAYKDIRDATRGLESENYRLASEYGVVGSGKYKVEAQKLRKLPEFSELKGKIRKRDIPKEAIDKIWGKLQELTGNREDFLRLVQFYRNLDRSRSGKSLNTGISRIEGLKEPERISAKVSREILGDYGNFTNFEESLRNGIVPFYSWLKINTSFWTKLFSRQGLTKKNVAVGGKNISRAGVKGLVWTVGGVHAVAFMYNNLKHPEQEERLPEWVKGRFHINTGQQTEDGKEIVITDPTALDDFLETIGMEGSSADVYDVLAGRKTIEGVAGNRIENIYKAPVKTVINRLTPYIKTPVEFFTQRKLFPDPFEPGWIYDDRRYGEAIKGIIGTDITKAGEAVRGKRDIPSALMPYSPIPFYNVKNYDNLGYRLPRRKREEREKRERISR